MALSALLLGALTPSAALADYRNPRLSGLVSWIPSEYRSDQSLVGLSTKHAQGRLQGSKKVRETIEVDLDRGVVIGRVRYGEALLAPEFVQDLRTAALAAASVSAWEGWEKKVRNAALKGERGRRDGSIEIEIPVRFGNTIENVIGEGARLNLRGSERITFAGTTTIIEGGPTVESGDPSLFPDLDMRQQLKVNLDGTIGRKIHVLVNHDSEVDTDFENKIQLRYDGDPDEVVQKIEMGNTDLSLPGSEFLSFRKSQQGLFGAKMIAQAGPMDFTVIASKQEGKTASQTFVGQARRDSVVIRDWDYAKRTYYWVEHPITLATEAGLLPLDDFDVYLDDKRPDNDIDDGARLSNAYVDPLVGTPADSSGIYTGYFHRLTENQDYTIDRQTGVLTMERPVGSNEAIALFYTRADGDSVGSAATADTLTLQLLSPPVVELYDPGSGFAPLQVREQKNVYSIGGRNINADSFELRILRKASVSGQQDEDAQPAGEGEAETEYVRILGLDYEGVATPEPDLKPEPVFVDFEEGTLTFPNLTPFAPDSSIFGGIPLNVIVSPDVVSTGRTIGSAGGETGPELAEYNEAIYTLEPDDLFNQEKYLLEVKFTTPTPSYNLNRFNILEGSERVTLNGRQLQRGVDYDIDYDFGILTFRTEEANDPDAEIEVNFEFTPLFGQAKESLVGISSTYNFSPRAKLSSSWLFFTRATPEERPRLGQEPSRILVGNLYGNWSASPDFLSDLVNKVPLVRTEVASQVQVQGEVALSIPNPNTKNQIYIDDMEGVEDSRELSITRGVWFPASEPVGQELIRPQEFNWYNPENTVRRKDVFTELENEREGQEFLQVLEFRYRDQVSADSTGWLGVMRNLSATGEDYSEKKFLEVWVNDFEMRTGRMYVDLGEISEDFYVDNDAPERGRGQLDTEDFDPEDGALTVSKEDFGLDNVKGTDGSGVEGDDGDDDFFFERREGQFPDYDRINNFEGNSLLDTEDLDRDRTLDEDNSYLQYEFDLATTSPQQVLDNGNGWRLFRLRLDEGVAVGGVPRLRAVKYVRLWFDGVGGGPGPKFQVASVKIVGSAWLEEKLSTNDTVEPVPDPTGLGAFGVNVVNNKEDPEYFSPFDPGEDSNNEERREQSIAIEYSGIVSSPPAGNGLQASAYKQIFDTGQGRSQDFTQYESMSLYLRDGVYQEDGRHRDVYSSDEDDNPGDVPLPEYADGSEGTFFLRFGPDTTNFYEFSTTELPGGPERLGWREIFIDLNELAELKLDPPQTTRVVEGLEVDYRATVVEGDTLAVYGEPSLDRVRRITMGVRGDDPARTEVSGEVWVNELRLRSVLRDPGYAARVSGSAAFADFANVQAGARRISSEFRRIEGDRHGTNEQAWSVGGDVNLNKFVDGYGFSMPISADYSESQRTPRLAPNSDIVLEDEKDKVAARSTNRNRSFSTRLSKTRGSKSSWIRHTIEALTLSAQTSTDDSRDPFSTSRRQQTGGTAQYSFNPQTRALRIFGASLSYTPTVQLRMNGALNTTEAKDVELDADGNRIETPRAPVRTRNLKGTMDVNWDPLRTNTLDTSFNFRKQQNLDLRQDLALWESFKRGGREETRNHGGRVSYRPNYLRWLRPVLTYETSYGEDQSPTVQEADIDSLRVFRVNNSSKREVTTSLNFRNLLKRVEDDDRRPRTRGANPSRGRRSTPRNSGAGDNAPPGQGQNDVTPRGENGEGETDPAADGTEGEGDSEEEEEGGGLPGPKELYDRFVALTHMFGDIRFTYTDERGSRFSRVRDRPDFGYQFGFSTLDLDLIIPRSGQSLIEDNSSNAYTSRMDTNFSPFSTVFVSMAYSRRIDRKNSSGSRQKSDDVTFPDLSLSLDGLEQQGLFRRWAKAASVQSSFRRSTGRSGRLPGPNKPADPDVPWYDDERIVDEFSPFASLTASWKSGINTTLSHDRSTTKNISARNNTFSETTDRRWSFSSRYAFAAPNGISFLGRRIRFRSDLTLNLNIERSEAKTVVSDGNDTTTRDHETRFSVKPRATYNFSRKVTGSLDISYSKNRNIPRDLTTTVVSVAVEALVKF